jgi:hypothetical protein
MSQTINVTGPIIGTDGNQTQSRGGHLGETVVTELHGKYYEQTSRGNTYLGRSASAGIAILLPATGGGHPTLWNPLGSGVNASLICLELSYVSGTAAPGAFEWASTLNAGATIGTGAPVVTFTAVASTNMLMGSGNVGKCLWAPTVNTFTAAPVFYRPLGFGQHTITAAAAVDSAVLRLYYDGDFVIPPGNAISLCYQTTTTTCLYQVGLVYEEVPQ